MFTVSMFQVLLSPLTPHKGKVKKKKIIDELDNKKKIKIISGCRVNEHNKRSNPIYIKGFSMLEVYLTYR